MSRRQGIAETGKETNFCILHIDFADESVYNNTGVLFRLNDAPQKIPDDLRRLKNV